MSKRRIFALCGVLFLLSVVLSPAASHDFEGKKDFTNSNSSLIAPRFPAKSQDTPALPLIDPSLYRFVNLSTGQGLVQSTVTVMYQDQFGFMWLGTYQGLSRFDGKKFTNYSNNPTDSNSLPGNNITFITGDSTGLIWVATTQDFGLASYDFVTDRISRYVSGRDNTTGLPSGNILGLYEDTVGRMITASSEEVARFDRSTKRFNKITWDKSAQGTILAIHQDAQKVIWMLTTRAIERWDATQERFEEYSFNPQQINIDNYSAAGLFVSSSGVPWVVDGKTLYSLDVQTGKFTGFPFSDDVIPPPTSVLEASVATNFLEDSNNNLWISLRQHVFRFDIAKQQFRDFEVPALGEEAAAFIRQDSNGRIWFGGGQNSGLWYFDPELGRFSQLTSQANDTYGYDSRSAVSMYEDRSGVLWFGTFEKGVYKLDVTGMHFNTMRHVVGQDNSLSTSYIYSIYKDRDGILWVGGDDGVLNRVDQTHNTFDHYIPNANDPTALNASYSVSAILEDSQSQLWVGTFGGGLHILDRDTGHFTRFAAGDASGLRSDNILNIYESADHTLWIAQTQPGGLQRYDRQTKTFLDIKAPANDPITSSDMRVIYEDRQQNLWVGSWFDGLYRVRAKTGEIQHFQHESNDAGSLSNDAVLTINEDRLGNIWIGTSAGLNKFRPDDGKFDIFGSFTGLPNNIIYAVMADKSNNLWLSSNQGIARFNPETKAVKNYTLLNGIQDLEFNQTAYFQASDGEMYFGGINGLNYFNPDLIRVNSIVPPAAITSFKIFDNPVPITTDGVLQKSALTTPAISLAYTDNTFSFEFAGLQYNNPDLNRYRYRLVGFENDWNEVGSDRRFANYTNIPGGNYQFEVQASNEDGVWNEKTASIQLTIVPPFWDTLLFRLLVIVGIALLLLATIRIRTLSIIRRNKELKNIVEQRTRDLQVSADISRQIATILNQNDLLEELVNRTAKAFNFHYVGIHAIDPVDNLLRLVAGTGEAGKTMVTYKKSFSLSDTGLVPSAAYTKKPKISNNVASDGTYFANPLLPETKSEAAIPILFQDNLLGVLDLQAIAVDRFTANEIQLFSTFADQIAVAFRNANLFEQKEIALKHAEEADKAKSAFLASTSHELRTPLNAIINLTSFVKRGLMGPTTPRQEETLALVMQSGRNLLSLINDVLDMSKIESGSLKLYIEPDVNIKPIVETACETAKSLLQDKSVNLTSHIAQNIPLIAIDKHRFQQILLNLLSNACKFTDEGEIHVQVGTQDDNLTISVEDTGEGIASEDFDKVFEKFTQTDSGLRQGGGTGLGMPITKSLVEAHGGHIWVESKLGEGTTFFVTIPLKRPIVNATLKTGVLTS